MSRSEEDTLVRSLLGGVAAFRWVAWAWLAVVLVVTRGELARGALAVALASAALAVTVVLTLMLGRGPGRLLSPGFITAELAVAIALSLGDGLAYDAPHPQSLGSAWPLAGILTAGIAWAGRGGAIAGAAVGLARLGGTLLSATGPGEDTPISALSTIVLYALAGGAAGFATVRLREAERRISIAQAREEVARTLHDGVLQTLAVVQRRAGDPSLARLAREQERELREYLFDVGPAGGGDLGTRLRAVAARFEDRFDGRATVVVDPDVATPAPLVVDALVGAVSEALANAGKHGHATRVTVYVGPGQDAHPAVRDGVGDRRDLGRGLACSVKDDGVGFEPGDVVEGVGVTRSMRARIDEVGGHLVIDANPGHGTEVRLWVPT